MLFVDRDDVMGEWLSCSQIALCHTCPAGLTAKPCDVGSEEVYLFEGFNRLDTASSTNETDDALDGRHDASVFTLGVSKVAIFAVGSKVTQMVLKVW